MVKAVCLTCGWEDSDSNYTLGELAELGNTPGDAMRQAGVYHEYAYCGEVRTGRIETHVVVLEPFGPTVDDFRAPLTAERSPYAGLNFASPYGDPPF